MTRTLSDIDPLSLSVSLSTEAAWWQDVALDYVATTSRELMQPAILAARSMLHDSTKTTYGGGPFGAAYYLPHQWRDGDGKLRSFDVFNPGWSAAMTFDSVESWRLLALGSNRVVPDGSADLHAELVAGRLAAARLQKLGVAGTHCFWPSWVICVTTSAPCEMCAHYLTWAKVRAILCGTSRADTIDRLGFHEGIDHEPSDRWISRARAHGMVVHTDIMRSDIVAALFDPYKGGLY